MKFKSLFNKKIESKDKKTNKFTKMLVTGAAILTLWGCDHGSNFNYEGWETNDNEMTDTDTELPETKKYCDSSILDKPFSNNISLVKDESMYLFNRAKLTFEGLKNNRFNLKITPEFSDSYNVLLNQNTPLQIQNEKGDYNIVKFCSYDKNSQILSIASDNNFLPYIFKGENTTYEEIYGIYNQLIYRSFFIVEGNSITSELLYSEQNWIMPNLNNLEERQTLKFNEEEWLVTNLGYGKKMLFKESSFYGGMSEGSDLLYNNISITYISKISENNMNYIVFELKGDSIQKIVIPENEKISVNFEGQEIILYVKKIYDGLDGNPLCDLSVIAKNIEFSNNENEIELDLYGIPSKAYVSYSDYENTTKLELYPTYDFDKLIKRKEREE